MSLTAKERTCYEHPQLWSWWSADNLVDGSGNYADKGPRGINWKQATVGSQPAVVNNWRGLTGINACTFDGAATVIPLNGRCPAGPISIVALLDLDSTVGGGDNINRCVAATQTAHVVTIVTKFREINRTFKLFCRNSSSAATGASAVSVPILVTWVSDPIAKTLGVRINGGVFATAASTTTSEHFATSLQLGAAGGNDLAIAEYYKGNISEVMVYNCALSASQFSQQLYDAEHNLAARGGLTIP